MYGGPYINEVPCSLSIRNIVCGDKRSAINRHPQYVNRDITTQLQS